MSVEHLALDGSMVVVTGAAGGIGDACVRLLAGRGASVLAVDLHPPAERWEVVADQGSVRWVEADVATGEGWDLVRREAVQDIAPLRGLVNSAGVLGQVGIARTTREHWDALMGVNLTGTWLGMKTLTPLIAERGGGSIVNISSAAGLDQHPDAAYTASKWGVRGLTKTAAQELGRQGVRVNSLHPGFIDTEMGAAASKRYRRAMVELLPVSRPGQAWEVAELVAFLLSDAAAYVTGAEIAVDGGWTSGVQAFAARRTAP